MRQSFRRPARMSCARLPAPLLAVPRLRSQPRRRGGPACRSHRLRRSPSAAACSAAPRTAAAPKRPSSEADQRHPRRLPFGFHIALRRRAAGRARRAHVPRTQPGGGLAILPDRPRRDRRRCANPSASGPGAATPDAGAPAAPTDRLVIPRLPLRAEIMILRVCAADHRDLCGDVPPGGGRIVGCLARNAPRLMPECRAVLSEIAARGRIACACSLPRASLADLPGPCYRRRHVSPRHRVP